MGSLNQDGSVISQSRKTVRNIGGAETLSADRVESEVIQEQSPEAASDELGTNANLTTSQYSTVGVSETVKITTPTSDSLIERISEEVTETPVGVNPPWAGQGVSWPLTIPDGLGTISQFVGSTDEQIHITAGSGQAFRVEAGDKDGTVGGSFGGQIRLYAGYGTNGADGGIVDIAAGDGEDGGDAFFYAGGGTATAGDTFVDAGPGPGAVDGILYLGTSTGYNRSVVIGASFAPVTVPATLKQARRDVEVKTVTTPITLAATSGNTIIVMGTAWRLINLPASPSAGQIYDIKDGDGTASSGTIVINGNGKTIDGATSGSLDTNYDARTVVYNGTQWNNI